MRCNARQTVTASLLLLTALMQGCATPSPASTPVQPPQIPSPPATLMKPVQPGSYLERARKNIEQWQQKLTSSPTK